MIEGLDYNDLVTFVRVAERTSFVSAARHLQVPPSTVSRRVARLEERLGVRLLHRSSRRVRLTDVGQAYFERCLSLCNEIDGASEALGEGSKALEGLLRVTAPVTAGSESLGPWLLEFARAHPAVVLDLRLTNTRADLVEERVDLAFRLGPFADSELIARKLWDVPYAFFAGRSFARTLPGRGRRGLDPRALSTLPAVVAVTPRWRLLDAAGSPVVVEPRAAFRANDLALALRAVGANLGLGLLPRAFALRTAGEAVVEVPLEGAQAASREMYAVYPSRKHLSPKVRAAVEHVERRYRECGALGPIASAASPSS